ncbi:MAG: hypothetical protein JW763_09865 [candidate division Zixibacteria bacterium]|nr:hypothetical protein [candidate division Zixibacteria bacterium]
MAVVRDDTPLLCTLFERGENGWYYPTRTAIDTLGYEDQVDLYADSRLKQNPGRVRSPARKHQALFKMTA